MSAPQVALKGLDHLWIQITGTLCNLTCQHCFISCSPTNRNFELISRERVLAILEESQTYGVKEYYFTGGEPFIHPDLVEILTRTLEIGPATVLTNATLFKGEALAELARAEAESIYSLEFRVSLDGHSPETNDPIRGQGTFERAMAGVELLLNSGFLPVITVAQTWEDGLNDQVFEQFVRTLKRAGYERPRIKIIPTLRIGAETERNRGYFEEERVTEVMMEGFDESTLICTNSRIVTSKGVYVCPILIDSEEARMGEELSQAFGSYPLQHGACYTCYLGGAICSNLSSGAGGSDGF